MSDESIWIEKAQSAEAQNATLRDNMDRIKEDARRILDTFGARKNSDGSFSIDFDKLVANLGMEQCMELRHVIDTHWQVSGQPGDKPRIKLSA